MHTKALTNIFLFICFRSYGRTQEHSGADTDQDQDRAGVGGGGSDRDVHYKVPDGSPRTHRVILQGAGTTTAAGPAGWTPTSLPAARGVRGARAVLRLRFR